MEHNIFIHYLQGVSKTALQPWKLTETYAEDIHNVLNCQNVAKHTEFYLVDFGGLRTKLSLSCSTVASETWPTGWLGMALTVAVLGTTVPRAWKVSCNSCE